MAQPLSGTRMGVLLALSTLLAVGFAGCSTPEPQGWYSFDATYRDEEYRTYHLSLGMPKAIADGWGVPRLAYPLVIDGDADPITTFQLDGAFNVVRIDEYCLDGSDCNYHYFRYPTSHIPAPMGIGINDRQTLEFTDEGSNQTIPITDTTLAGTTAKQIAYEHVNDPAWLGHGIRGTFALNPNELAPATMSASWSYGAREVLAKRETIAVGSILPEIPKWPAISAFSMYPAGGEDYLDTPWRGEDWIPREPFKALLAQSETARNMRAAGACIATAQVTATDGYEGPERGVREEKIEAFSITLRLESDVKFHVQKGGFIVDDLVFGREWRVTYEEAVEALGDCSFAPRPNVDVGIWVEHQSELVTRAKALPLVRLEAANTGKYPHEAPASWRNAVLVHSFQPDHVVFDKPVITYIPYLTVLDANHGRLMQVVVHPVDAARLDSGAWAPVFEAIAA